MVELHTREGEQVRPFLQSHQLTVDLRVDNKNLTYSLLLIDLIKATESSREQQFWRWHMTWKNVTAQTDNGDPDDMTTLLSLEGGLLLLYAFNFIEAVFPWLWILVKLKVWEVFFEHQAVAFWRNGLAAVALSFTSHYSWSLCKRRKKKNCWNSDFLCFPVVFEKKIFCIT